MQSSQNSSCCRFRTCCILALLIAGVPIHGLAAIASGQGTQKKKYEAVRHQMVERYVRSSGVTNERVLASMMDAPREMFVPDNVRDQAYLDAALPIGHDQTISSPFIVAFMTEAIDPQADDRVLEIGTGSGYQAAILSPLVKDVYTIEIVEPLGKQAEKTLQRLKYDNVHVRVGDGFLGWPEQAPFNKIIVTCSPEKVPEPLKEQLAEGGLMVIPVGERHQQYLMLYRKVDGELEANPLQPTLFVPMTGAAEEQRQILPDAANPVILNGDFEEDLPENGHVAGWYYQRYMELVEDPKAPSGSKYVKFAAETPGRNAHLMQGFAIDGNEVGKLRLSASVKLEKVIAGPNPMHDLPVVHVAFYDAERRETGSGFIGPFRGTRDWQNLDHEIEVPKNTHEAIVRIGLFGATGIACFDNIMIRAEKRSR